MVKRSQPKKNGGPSKVGLRGAPKRAQASRAVKSAIVRAAPASIGTSIMAAPPNIKHRSNGAEVVGRDFVGGVSGYQSGNFHLGLLQPLSPAYFLAGAMSGMARVFEKYRFRSIRLTYITRTATSSAGEIVLTYNEMIEEPAINSTVSTFLNRAMSIKGSMLGPIWQNLALTYPVDNKYRYCNPLTPSGLLDDAILGEFYAYAQASQDIECGYICIDYDIEFQGLSYQPHAGLLPIVGGVTTSLTSQSAPVNLHETVIWSSPQMGQTTATGPGSVYKVVLTTTIATFPAGFTKDTLLANVTERYDAPTVVASHYTNISLNAGTTLYAMVTQEGYVVLYTSYNAAITGIGSGCLVSQEGWATYAMVSAVVYQIRFPSIDQIRQS